MRLITWTKAEKLIGHTLPTRYWCELLTAFVACYFQAALLRLLRVLFSRKVGEQKG